MIDVILYIVLASPLPGKKTMAFHKARPDPGCCRGIVHQANSCGIALRKVVVCFSSFMLTPCKMIQFFEKKIRVQTRPGLRLGVYFWGWPHDFCAMTARPLTSDDLQDYDITLGPAFGVSAWTCVRSCGLEITIFQWGKNHGWSNSTGGKSPSSLRNVILN